MTFGGNMCRFCQTYFTKPFDERDYAVTFYGLGVDEEV